MKREERRSFVSRTWKDSGKRDAGQRRISVRAVRRNPPDMRRLSRALIELAMAQAQAEAEAQDQAESKQPDEGNQLSRDGALDD